MPTFAYSARDSAGRAREGSLDSASSAAAVDELRGRGWLVLDIGEASGAEGRATARVSLNPLHRLPVRSLDVELSLRQMAVMLRSGLTLLDSLITVADQAQRPAMARVWREVAGQIQEGASLADAMSRHSRFSSMVVELVRVGGATGHLEPVLTRAAETLERRRQLRTSMLTALAYPMIVLVAAFGVTAFMALSVIPKLEKFLSTIGRRLPPMTRLLMDITHAIQTYLPHCLVLMVVLAAAAIAGYCWPPTRMVIDRWALRVPLVGKIFRLAGTVGFAGNLGALLNSGIRILEGLRTVERLQRNQYLALQIAQARDAVMHGTNLASPLATPYAFMPMLSRMVAVGESAGTLDEVLAEVARFYESQLQSTIRRLSVIVEPVIIVVVGGIVGFVYISFFMALFAAGGAS